MNAIRRLDKAQAGTPKVQSVIAEDKDSKPTDKFSADVPQLYAFFKSTGTKKGDSLRGAWLAEDVGDAAPKGTKIDESTLTADQDDFSGTFSLSKPTKGWAVGDYRVDILPSLRALRHFRWGRKGVAVLGPHHFLPKDKDRPRANNGKPIS